jgi:hypothetical protein
MRDLYFEVAEDVALYERKWALIGDRCLSTAETADVLRSLG